MKLEIPIIVGFDNMESLLDDLKKLQTYKLFEGDEMVLVDLDDVADVLVKHIKAKEKRSDASENACEIERKSNDCISRQDAIDVLGEIPVREFKKTDDGLLDALVSIGQVFRALEQLPSAHPEIIACGQGELVQDGLRLVQDCIDRQMAIDALAELPYGIRGMVKGIIEHLPSAQPEILACGSGELVTQPEIIRCKDCKHYYYADNRVEAEQCYVCGYWDFDSPSPNGFCSFAERRTE